MIYFFDLNKELIKVVGSQNVIQAVHEQELNGMILSAVELDLNYAKEFIDDSEFFGYFYEEIFYMHKIRRVEETHTDENIAIIGRHIFFDEMLVGELIKETRPRERDAVYTINNTIGTVTDWTAYSDGTTKHLDSSFYWDIPMEALEQITKDFTIDYLPVMKFDGKKITSKEIFISEKLGKDTGIRVAYGSKLLTLTRDVDYDGIVTKLFVQGKGEEVGDGYGRRINIKDVDFERDGVVSPDGDYYMYSEELIEEYGLRHGKEIFEDIEEVDELVESAYEYFLNNSRPRMVFSAEVAQIGDVGIGDTVNIIRRTHELYFKARIHKITVNLLYPEDAKIELGDYEHFKESKSDRIERKKDEQFKSETDSRIESLKRHFDFEFDSKVDELIKEFEQAKIDAFAEIEAMEHRFDAKFERELSEFNDKFQDLLDRANQLTKEEVERITRELRNDFDRIQNEMGDRLGEFEREDENIWNKLDEIIDEIPTLTEDEKHADGLKKEIADLRSEIEDINARPEREREEVRDEISEEEQRLEDLRAEIEQIIDERNRDYRLELSRKEQDLSDLEDEIEKRIEDDKDDLQREIDELRELIEKTVHEYDRNIDDRKNDLQNEHDGYVDDLDNFAKLIDDERNKHVERLEQEQQGKRDEIERVEQRVEEVKKAVVEQLEEDKKVKAEEISEVKEQLSEVRNENKQCHEWIEKINENNMFNPYAEDEVIDLSEKFLEEFDKNLKALENFMETVDTTEVTKDLMRLQHYQYLTYSYYYYYYDIVKTYGYGTEELDKYKEDLVEVSYEDLTELESWVMSNYSQDERANPDYEALVLFDEYFYRLLYTYSEYLQEFYNIMGRNATSVHDLIERIQSDMHPEKPLENEIKRLEQEFKEVEERIENGDIDGVDVKGVNLLENTDMCTTGRRHLTTFNNNLASKLKPDTEYTYSVDVKINNSTNIGTYIIGQVIIRYTDNSMTIVSLSTPSRTLNSNVNTRVSKTFKTSNKEISSISQNYYGTTSKIGDFQQFCNPQLEEGNVATAWAPHPSEISDYINNLNQEITTLSDRIAELKSWDITTHENAIKLNDREQYITIGLDEIKRKLNSLNELINVINEMSYTAEEQQHLDELNSRLEQLIKDRDTVSITSDEQRQIDELQAEIERLKRLIESRPLTEQEINSINVLQENIKILTSRLNGITDNLTDEERKQLSGLNGAISGLTDDLKETEKRINPLIEDVYDLVDRIASVEKTQDGEIAKLHSVESDVDGITRRLVEVETTQDSEIAKTNDLKISVDGLSSNLKSLESKHDSEVVKTNKLSQSIDDTISRLTSVERTQSNETERISQVRQDLSSLSGHFRELSNDINNPNNPVLKQLDIKAGIDGFYVRNQKVMDGQTMAGYIMATENTVSNGVRDALTENDVTINNAGVKIGSKQLTGSQMASSIVVSPQAIDLISRNINIDGNLNVLGKIQAESAKIAKAEIADAYISKLTANTVDTIHLKSEAVTATKLKVDNALANKLIANYVLSNHIETKSIEAVNGRFGSLFAQYIRTAVIEADQLRSSTALFDKVFASDAYIRRLTSQTAFIRDIQAIDLTASRITSINGTNSTRIIGGYLESRGQYRRTWFGEPERNADVGFLVKDGHIRFENFIEDKRLYYSDRGISTFLRGYDDEDPNSEFHGSGVIEFFSHQFDRNVRGLTLFSNRGTIGLRTLTRDIVLDSDREITLSTNRGDINFELKSENRAGRNSFNMYVKNNPSGSDTDGILRYGSELKNFASGLRFKKTTAGRPEVWVTNGNGDKNTGDLHARSLHVNGGELNSYDIRTNRLWTQTNNSFIYVGSDLGLRVTSRGTNDNSIIYRPIQAGVLRTNDSLAIVNDSTSNMYIGVGTSSQSIRFTNRSGYNNGNIAWRDIEFRNWSANSYELNKYAIEDWNLNVLDIFKNDLKLKRYKWNDDKENQNNFYHHGIVTRVNPNKDEFPSEWRKENSFDGNEVLWWTVKGVQELAFENDELKSEIKELNTKINKLMEMVA